MEVWSLETEGGVRLGYRVKTDCNNVYDIKTDMKIPSKKCIIGFITDNVFKTDVNDVVMELESDSPSSQVLLTAVSDRSNGMFGFDILSGEKLKKVIGEYSGLNKRKYVNGCVENLLDTS